MILNGIDNIEEYDYLFKNKKLGLITSVSGVNKNLVSSIKILHQRYGLTALFSPEHGVRGNADAGADVENYTDPYTGIPVFSLYTQTSKNLTQEMLDMVDAIVYDIQDVGVRFYTFISTLLYAMQACAGAGKELIILDRINPLGGTIVEGNILKPEFFSFVGAFPLCIRYGLTCGEFAQMANEQNNINCTINIVHCKNWNRDMIFPQTKLLWMMPSLGIPHFETAYIYPGTCLIEGTNISEGRGTSCPFELIGAPFIDAQQLTKTMNKLKLSGVIFTPSYFVPTSSKHAGNQCQGIHIHITDYTQFKPVQTGLHILYTIRSLYPHDFTFLPPHKAESRHHIDILTGMSSIRNNSISLEQILYQYQSDQIEFSQKKATYHLYK